MDEPLVLAGAITLAVAVGLLAWRRRSRIRPALKSNRALTPPFGQRWRARFMAWAKDLERRRAKSSTPIPYRTPAMDPLRSSRRDTVSLPVDTLDRLRALALPNESLPSVIARAVTVLESAAETPPTTLLSRLQTLETRLAHLERDGAAKGTDPSARNL